MDNELYAGHLKPLCPQRRDVARASYRSWRETPSGVCVAHLIRELAHLNCKLQASGTGETYVIYMSEFGKTILKKTLTLPQFEAHKRAHWTNGGHFGFLPDKLLLEQHPDTPQ